MPLWASKRSGRHPTTHMFQVLLDLAVKRTFRKIENIFVCHHSSYANQRRFWVQNARFSQKIDFSKDRKKYTQLQCTYKNFGILFFYISWYTVYEKIYEVMQFLYIKNAASVNFQTKIFWAILNLRTCRYAPKLKNFQKNFVVHQRGRVKISAWNWG